MNTIFRTFGMRIACAIVAMMAIFGALAQNVTPAEAPAKPYVGAWLSEGLTHLRILSVEDNGTFTIFITSEDLYDNGQYIAKVMGEYKEIDGSTFQIMIEDDEAKVKVKKDKKGKVYLDVEGNRFDSIERDKVPTKKSQDNNDW